MNLNDRNASTGCDQEPVIDGYKPASNPIVDGSSDGRKTSGTRKTSTERNEKTAAAKPAAVLLRRATA